MITSSSFPGPVFARLRAWLHGRQTERQLIDHVVETVEPKIRLASGYRKQLRGPLQTCLGHCKMMVASIPGPIHLKDGDYDADPLIHAAFIGPVKLKDLIANQEISLISSASGEPERYALLSMTHREATVFGPKNEGGMILQDAQMRAVTFTDHKLIGLATSLQSSRSLLEKVCI